MRFLKDHDDADGIGVYQANPLTERGIKAQVWRMSPGCWGWSLVWPNGHELPADESHRTRHEAQRAAAAWWQQHGAKGIDNSRQMHLGEWRRFLANTSERTTKRTLAHRLAKEGTTMAETIKHEMTTGEVAYELTKTLRELAHRKRTVTAPRYRSPATGIAMPKEADRIERHAELLDAAAEAIEATDDQAHLRLALAALRLGSPVGSGPISTAIRAVGSLAQERLERMTRR